MLNEGIFQLLIRISMKLLSILQDGSQFIFRRCNFLAVHLYKQIIFISPDTSIESSRWWALQYIP